MNAIIKLRITLAYNPDIKVVGEGVEREEQMDFLSDNGCDFLQGYYFSKPLTVKQMEEVWIKNTNQVSNYDVP